MPLPPTIQSLTLDDAFLRSHKSMSNILSALASYDPSSQLQRESDLDLDLDTLSGGMPSKSRSASKLHNAVNADPQLGLSTSSNASTAAHESQSVSRSDSESTLATGISNNSSSSSLLRVRLGHGMMKKSMRDLRAARMATGGEEGGGKERISFLDWSPPSSESDNSDDEDLLRVPTNPPRIRSNTYGQSSSQPSSSHPSPTAPPGHTPASPPLNIPASELTPSFWLVADPNANPLARRGADEALPTEECEDGVIDVVIIGSGITGASFLMKFVEGWMKERDAGMVEGKKGMRIVMLEARDFCESHAFYALSRMPEEEF